MQNIDNIDDILNAVNEINLKKKKKNTISDSAQIIIPKLNQELKISPDVDRLITEAEDYKILSSKLPQEHKVEKKIDTMYSKKNKTFDEVEAQIIDDLYSKLTKKVKKKTLKVIFNLHMKIKHLEKKLKNLQVNEKKPLILEHPIIKKTSTIKLDHSNVFKDEVITSLKIQDSTIAILNEKIKDFKKKEEKLLHQIIDLEQDKGLLLGETRKFEKLKNSNTNTESIKVTLKSIYKQVEKQKLLFVDLKINSEKTKQNSIFFKENYEKLIIENNETNKRLKIAKEQIAIHEINKQDLLLSINRLNEILSKTNVAAKISPQESLIDEGVLKIRKKIEIVE